MPNRTLTDADIEALHQAIARRVFVLEEGHKEIRAEIAENTNVTKEIRDILGAVKGGLKFLGGLGVVAKWTTTMIAAGCSIFGLVHWFKGNP